MITLEQIEPMTFAQLINWSLKNAFPTVDPSEQVTQLGGSSEVMTFLLKKYGQVKKEALITELTALGLIDGNVPATAVAAPAPAPQEATQAAPAPAPAPVQAVAPQAAQAPVQEPVVASPPPVAPQATLVPTTDGSVPTANFPLFRDEKRSIRTAEGKYVCMLCLRDGAADPFTAVKAVGLGGHARSHEDRTNKGNLNVDGLPPFDHAMPGAVAAQTVAPAAPPVAQTPATSTAVQQSAPAPEHTTVAAPTQEQPASQGGAEEILHRALNDGEEPRNVSPEARNMAQMEGIPVDLKEFLGAAIVESEGRVNARIDNAVIQLTRNMLAISTLPDSFKAELWEELGKTNLTSVIQTVKQ